MKKPISARQVILTSFFVDILDIVLNLAVALLTGSVILVSELVQGTSDLIASGLLLIGLKRPKSERYYWALVSSLVMLLVASTLSFYFGLKRFLNPVEIANIWLGYIVLVIAVTSNGYAFLLSAKRILAKKSYNHILTKFTSSSLIMTKNTFVLDLMGMSAALVGLIALVLYHLTGQTRFDGLGAMGIGLILAVLSLNLIINIKKMKKKSIAQL